MFWFFKRKVILPLKEWLSVFFRFAIHILAVTPGTVYRLIVLLITSPYLLLSWFFVKDGKITKTQSRLLPWIPIIFLMMYYVGASVYRHHLNPMDKILPTIPQMWNGIYNAATVPDDEGNIWLWKDIAMSVYRFLIALFICYTGILWGLYIALFPRLELLWHRSTVVVDKIPALCILPIIFMVFGIGEAAKIALLTISVLPTIVLDTYIRAKQVPQEHYLKAESLAASNFELGHRIILPQIMPNVLETIKLNLKAMWNMLIVGEFITANCGLGYRIYTQRRFTDMATVYPYVIVITLLGVGLFGLYSLFINKRYSKWREG